MFDSITLGQYYQTDSALHRLDPRVKLVGTFAYLIALFVVDSWVGYLLAALFLAAMIRLSNVPFRYIVRGMKTILFLLLITVCFNLFLTPGEVIWQFGFLKMSREGLSFAIKMALRLSLLILGSSIMTLTTTPTQLTDALESLMRPLKKIHVPVHEISMMMSDRERRRFREQEPGQKDQEPGSASGPAVYLCIPQSQRPGNGNGSPLLQGRRGANKDEAPCLSGKGPRRIWRTAPLLCRMHCNESDLLKRRSYEKNSSHGRL